MEDLARLIPNSLSSFIGLAVIIVILIMIGTVAQEWGKNLYRWMKGNKEKRHESNADYRGIERRSENQHLERAVTDLLEAMKESNREMKEFVSALKASHDEVSYGIDEIKRKQEKNWKRLFDEELPSIHGNGK